jgi:DNA-binding CsgD family transcriptional regulator
VTRHELALEETDHGPGKLLTPRQREVVGEYVFHEDIRTAAFCIGVSVQTFKNHMTMIHARLDERSTLGVFRRLGYLHKNPGGGNEGVGGA